MAETAITKLIRSADKELETAKQLHNHQRIPDAFTACKKCIENALLAIYLQEKEQNSIQPDTSENLLDHLSISKFLTPAQAQIIDFLRNFISKDEANQLLGNTNSSTPEMLLKKIEDLFIWLKTWL